MVIKPFANNYARNLINTFKFDASSVECNTLMYVIHFYSVALIIYYQVNERGTRLIAKCDLILILK